MVALRPLLEHWWKKRWPTFIRRCLNADSLKVWEEKQPDIETWFSVLNFFLVFFSCRYLPLFPIEVHHSTDGHKSRPAIQLSRAGCESLKPLHQRQRAIATATKDASHAWHYRDLSQWSEWESGNSSDGASWMSWAWGVWGGVWKHKLKGQLFLLTKAEAIWSGIIFTRWIVKNLGGKVFETRWLQSIWDITAICCWDDYPQKCECKTSMTNTYLRTFYKVYDHPLHGCIGGTVECNFRGCRLAFLRNMRCMIPMRVS